MNNTNMITQINLTLIDLEEEKAKQITILDAYIFKNLNGEDTKTIDILRDDSVARNYRLHITEIQNQIDVLESIKEQRIEKNQEVDIPYNNKPKREERTIIQMVLVCPKCDEILEEETNADARTLYHWKCKCGYKY